MSLFRLSRQALKQLKKSKAPLPFFDWQKQHLLTPEVFKHFAKFVEFYNLHFIEKTDGPQLSNEEFFKKYFVDPVQKSNEASKLVDDFLKEKKIEFATELENKRLLDVVDKSELYKYFIDGGFFDEHDRLIFDVQDVHNNYYQVGDLIVLNNKQNDILVDSLNLAVIVKLPSKNDLNMVCVSTTENIMSISKENVLFRMSNVFTIMNKGIPTEKLFSNLFSENPNLKEGIIPEAMYHYIPKILLEVLESIKHDLRKDIINKKLINTVTIRALKMGSNKTLNELYQQVIQELNILYPEMPYSTNTNKIYSSVYIAILYCLIDNDFHLYTNMEGVVYVNLKQCNDLKMTYPDFNQVDLNTVFKSYVRSASFANAIDKFKGELIDYGDINLYDVVKSYIDHDAKSSRVRLDHQLSRIQKLFAGVKISHNGEKTETKFMNPEKAIKSVEGKESAIYAIDSASTVEVDDGLSLEHIDENTSKVSCYVSAVSDYFSEDDLSKDKSELLANICSRNSSLYYLSSVDKMITVDAINDYYSLSAGNTNKPAMKFSVVIRKIEDGYEVDKDSFELSKVSAYENLKRVTYEEVDEIVSSEENSALKDLFEVSKSLRNDRKKTEFYKTLEFSNENTVQVKEQFTEFDIIINKGEKNSQILVSEFMLLFNHLTSVYCAKNNLPIIYRACPPSLGVDSSSQKIEGNILTYTANPKYAKFVTPESYYTRDPKPHYATGFEAYTHITSPLRRLPDLLNNLVLLKHLANKPLKPEELHMLQVIFEQNVCVGGQDTKRFNKYLHKYYLLKALKENRSLLEQMLKKGGVLSSSSFGENNQSDTSQKEELLPIQNINNVKTTATVYKNTLEKGEKFFEAKDRVFAVFEGCIVADVEIDPYLKTSFTECQVCQNLELHTLDPLRLKFSVKLAVNEPI